ncbi:phosphoprotein [Sprivivirus esox]|uniref:Phosphoprotein n=1 Tax=Sprivivirus esox TaxID=219584 RepID=C3VM12_9RHAB|nr:phosphoprotein [Sprivivirus esox]ACP27999.1 phosphoprotein [Sprivivirus esox]
MSLNSRLLDSLKAYGNLEKTVKEIETQVSALEEPVPKSVTYVTYENSTSDDEDDQELEDEDDDDLLNDEKVPDYLREERTIVVEEDEEQSEEEREDDLPRVEWGETKIGLDLGFGPGVVVPSISDFDGGTYVKYTGFGQMDPDVRNLISKLMKDLANQVSTKYGYDVDLFDYQGDFLEVFLPNKSHKEEFKADKQEVPLKKADISPKEREKEEESTPVRSEDECGRFPKEKEIKRREKSCLWNAVKSMTIQFAPWKEGDTPLNVTIRELFISEPEFNLHCSETQTELEMALTGIKLRKLYNKLYQKYRL